MDDHTTESEFIAHISCDACGSSDANSLYSDNHEYCHSCSAYKHGDGATTSSTGRKLHRMTNPDLIDDGETRALGKRGITEDTARRYGYKVGRYSGKTVQIAPYFDQQDNLAAQKLRFADKKDGMPMLGGDSASLKLFGQQLPVKSWKKLVITEGELDAMSMSQVQGNKWPVVSIRRGSKGASKDFKENLEWLEKFDSVVIMFDMDEPGQTAAMECARLLTPGKAKLAKLPLKDASDMMQAGRNGELIDAMWAAEAYRPDGIISGQTILDRMKGRPPVTSYQYPEVMGKLNEKTYGIRMAELTVWTSGTGMGKTTVIKQLQHHFWKNTPLNQAIIHLEEPLEDSAESLVGIHIGHRITLPDIKETVGDATINEAAAEIFLDVDDAGQHRIHLYDAFGSLGEDSLYSKIRYFAQALDCKIIWLDHLQILVSDSDEDRDERRLIDSIMHNLVSLAVELNIHIGLISHLKKAPQGKSFEEGYVPSLDDLRGSGGIKQLAYTVLALSRDQQAEVVETRNTSLITVLKCRYTGRTGPADRLLFDDMSGRMVEGRSPEEAKMFDDNDDADGEDAFAVDDVPF